MIFGDGVKDDLQVLTLLVLNLEIISNPQSSVIYLRDFIKTLIFVGIKSNHFGVCLQPMGV